MSFVPTAEPVRRIYFDSAYLDENRRLSVIAGRPVDVRCIAVGGSPLPRLDVHLDWFNITPLFAANKHYSSVQR